MQIKSILAFDIDGTLTKRNSYVVLPKVLPHLLRTLSKIDHYCIPVTGKPVAYANRIIEINNLLNKGIVAENAGVYQKPNGEIIIYEKVSVKSIYELRQLLGIEKLGGGIKYIHLDNNKYEVVVDPEDFSILTIFTNPEFVKHRWQFTKTISVDHLFNLLKQLITINNLSNDLEVLPPFPDEAIQIIRKNNKTGKIIDKSLLLDVVKEMYDLKSLPLIAMFGDGHNDIPAMTPQGVIPITFSNANPQVKQFVENKKGFVSKYSAPEEYGVIDGINWLADNNFFQTDSTYIKDLITKHFPY